ncbi:MAG: GNAT family N-acetyltransferase [Nitrospira sp.]
MESTGDNQRVLMIEMATEVHRELVWLLIDRCRTALLEQGIHQWDEFYPTVETVSADIMERRLYLLTSSGMCRAVVTIDTQCEPQYSTVLWATPEPALLVRRLCVDPAFQGRGYANQLMDYVEAYATQHRYASLRLDAYSGNSRALGLYQRRGYREAGHVCFPRRVLPFICFELGLEH